MPYKPRELSRRIRALSTRGKLDLDKVAALSDADKNALVETLVRYRQPVVKALLSPTLDRQWLAASGYLYETQGLYFTFVHTSEHHIKTQPGGRWPGKDK